MSDTPKPQKEVVCTFNKKMDTAECVKDELGILDKVKNAEKIIFDMEGVEYIASSFLRICRKAADEVEEGNFKIINTGPPISKVFKIAGLTALLNVS